MRMVHIGFLAGVACLFPAWPAEAGFSYQYVFDKPSYTSAPGGTLNIGVSLYETVTGADVSRLATDGLIGAGVRVRFDVAPLPGTPAKVLGSSAILPNTAAFDGTSFLVKDFVANSSAGFSEAVGLVSPAVTGTLISPGTYRVPLGSFQFTEGLVPGQTTNLLATIFSPTITETVTGAGLGLDAVTANGSATITVIAAVVPEPRSLVLLGLGALGVVGYARWTATPATTA